MAQKGSKSYKNSIDHNDGNTKPENGLIEVIKIDDFRKLWIGQIFSQLADKFYIVLMVYIIAQYWVDTPLQNDDALIGMASAIRINLQTQVQKITLLATGIYIANTLPAMLIGGLAGVGADRWPKLRIMVTSNGLRAALVLLTPLFLIKGPYLMGLNWGYWGLLLMTFIESTLTQFFAPAEQATIPLLVPPQYLLSANSLYQATSMGATIIGFALGEPIIRLLKEIFFLIGVNGGEYILLPFCYGMAAIVISSISLKERQNVSTKKNILQELKNGLDIIKERESIRKALLHLVLLYSLLAALYVLSISLASSISELGPTRFGTILSSSGLGITLGAIVLAQIGNRFNKNQLTALGLGLITWSLILLGHSNSSLYLTLILCGFLGVGAALVAIPAQTTIQEDTPISLRGKVFGLQNNFINIAISLPLVISGALLSTFGLVTILWLLASISFMAILLEQPWKDC